MFNVVIVDDDIISCDLMSGLLSKVEGVSSSHVFTNPLQAISYINENKVDLVFLDVEMPNVNGLEFILLIKNPAISFVLVSAKSEYAFKGFELNILDYMQKPVHFARLLASIEKFKKQRTPSQFVEEKNDFIFLKNESILEKYNKNDICFIKALGDYVAIHIGDKKVIILSTMSEVEKNINNKDLIRVHRSFIVNVSKIDKIEGETISCSNEFIPIGIRYKERFFNFIKYF